MGLDKLPGWATASDAVAKVDLVKVVGTLDWAVNAGRLELKRRRQSLRPTVVVAYRGWHHDGVAHLTARCIEKPMFAPSQAPTGTGEVLKANLRRFLVLTIAEATVTASMGSVSGQFTSDADGYLHITLPVGELSPGWHVMDIDPGPGPIQVSPTVGRVFVPDPAGGVAVISDVDDTILKTGLTQRWTAVGRTVLRDVADRTPVPGMAALYSVLNRGNGPARTVPFYYVSTGSWNFYDYLVAFLDLHGFPRGPLFLTDWGPSSSRLMRDGREHKRSTIRTLIEGHSGYDWVLIGDVGQGDPETYEVMAREFTGRVRAILLVYVGSHLAQRSEEVAARAERLRQEGIPMYYVQDAGEAAEVLRDLGLVDARAAEDVIDALPPR